MQSLFQPVRSDRPKPTWFRWVAVVCVLMVCVMSTVQAFHTHDARSYSKQDSRQNRPTPEDHCPLCVAMHSALATPQHFTPEPTLSIQRLDSVAAEAERIFRWRFEMASRPPPVQDNA